MYRATDAKRGREVALRLLDFGLAKEIRALRICCGASQRPQEIESDD